MSKDQEIFSRCLMLVCRATLAREQSVLIRQRVAEIRGHTKLLLQRFRELLDPGTPRWSDVEGG